MNRGVGMTTTCLIKFSKNKNEKNIVNVLKAQKKNPHTGQKAKIFLINFSLIIKKKKSLFSGNSLTKDR